MLKDKKTRVAPSLAYIFVVNDELSEYNTPPFLFAKVGKKNDNHDVLHKFERRICTKPVIYKF